MKGKNVFLDIETAKLANLPPPPEKRLAKGTGNLVDPAKIAAKETANIEAWETEAPLDWRRGQVIAAGLQFDEELPELAILDTEIYDSAEWTERQVLESLWQACDWKDYNAVGFGIRTFDIPFLIGRSAAVGCYAPAFKLARFRRDLGIIDLAEVLSFDREFDLTGWSLSYYCEFFGLDVEPYGKGEDVADWYRQGDWDSIRKHLRADIAMTRALYEFCALAFGI